jgi:hypothetical protein
MAYNNLPIATAQMINNPLLSPYTDYKVDEIFWTTSMVAKVTLVKSGTSNNVYSGCKTCIVTPVAMYCHLSRIMLVAQHAFDVTGLAVMRLACLNINEAMPKFKPSLSISITILRKIDNVGQSA